MVKHIVVFTLTGTPDERLALSRSFRDALLALPEKIECLESMEVGINENPSESADIVLTAIVPEMSDVAVYAGHPEHVKAAVLLKGHVAARSCVDYKVD